MYILDGLSLVNMLGLTHDSTTPADMALKQHKLDRYKLSAAEGVKSLTQRVGVFFLPPLQSPFFFFSNGGGGD